MNRYFFVGTLANVGGVKLDHLGQVIELTEAEAKHPRGPAVIPEEAWDACGFTAEELSKYQYPGPRAEAPQEFAAKFKQALVARHELVYGGDR